MRHSDVLRSTLSQKWPRALVCPNARFTRRARALFSACDALCNNVLYEKDFAKRTILVQHRPTYFGLCGTRANEAADLCAVGRGDLALARAGEAQQWLRKTRHALGPLWGQALLAADFKEV